MPADDTFPRTRLQKTLVITGWLVALAIGGWWWIEDNKREEEARAVRYTKRVEASNAAQRIEVVAQLPSPHGEMLVLDVLSRDQLIHPDLERRRCFVWRDAAGSSLACAGDRELEFIRTPR